MAASERGIEALDISDTDGFEKALDALKPTIIFLDISMPGRDGMELMGYLVAANYAGRLVVMNGSHPRYIQMSSTIGKTRGVNVAGTLAKPFRKRDVVDLLVSLALPAD